MVHDCQQDNGVIGAGSSNAKIMFIGTAPIKEEWQRSKVALSTVSSAGKMLNGLLKYVGLTRDEVYTTNLVCWWAPSPTRDEIERCQPRLDAEVAAVRPTLIVALGQVVTEYLLEMRFGGARAGFWWSNRYDCWVLSTFHTNAYVGHGSEVKVDIADGVRDFRKAVLCAQENWPSNYGDITYRVINEVWYPSFVQRIGQNTTETRPRQITALDNVRAFLGHFKEHIGSIVAIDVETKYDGTEMISVSFTCECGTYHIPREVMQQKPNFKVLESFNCDWTFHNGAFDTEQIRLHLDTNLPIKEDTMLMSYSLDERGGGDKEADSSGQDRSVGIHGLKRLAKEFCCAGNYSNSKLSPENMDPHQLAEYNSKDSAYTYRLAERFKSMQIEDNVRDMYLTLLVPAANVLSEIHQRGAYIDREALRQLALEWMPQWLETESQLMADAQGLGWPAEDINLNSPSQLSKFIYDVCKHRQMGSGKKARSTEKAILERIRLEDTPIGHWCAKLLDWRGLNHDITNYILVIDEQSKANGRIHPEALIHGTRVGRTAYHQPPVQTIPKARTVGEARARIRRIFAAQPPDQKYPDGYALLEADYRQAELYAAAMQSGDQQMLEDLLTGDFHARVAEASFGVTKDQVEPVVWELYRDSAKTMTFGKFYGAKTTTMVGERAGRILFKTRAEAEKHDKNFDERYPEYYRWREEEKQHVLEEGEQQSNTGRKRRYHMIQDMRQLNQAINMPISSLSHDHIFIALIELHPLLKEFTRKYGLKFMTLWSFKVRENMAASSDGLNYTSHDQTALGSKYGIPVDIKAGLNWYDLVKPESLMVTA